MLGGGGASGTSEEGEEQKVSAESLGTLLSANPRDIPIVIDGVQYSEEAKKIVVKRYKKDNVHISVPLVSFLPLR